VVADSLLSGWAQCTSRSRSRPDGIDDAAHRKREAPPSARHSGPATYEEHNYLLLQQPSSDPINFLSSEMKSLYGSITRSAVISLSYVSFVFVICQTCYALSKDRTGIRTKVSVVRTKVRSG
jgi:hypothetical protein